MIPWLVPCIGLFHLKNQRYLGLIQLASLSELELFPEYDTIRTMRIRRDRPFRHQHCRLSPYMESLPWLSTRRRVIAAAAVASWKSMSPAAWTAPLPSPPRPGNNSTSMKRKSIPTPPLPLTGPSNVRRPPNPIPDFDATHHSLVSVGIIIRRIQRSCKFSSCDYYCRNTVTANSILKRAKERISHEHSGNWQWGSESSIIRSKAAEEFDAWFNAFIIDSYRFVSLIKGFCIIRGLLWSSPHSLIKSD